MYEIYVVTNGANGKKYVGQTGCGYEKRWKAHRNASRTIDNYFYRAIRKYGVEQFSIEVVATCETREEANTLEIQWIADLRSLDREEGYNGMLGGDGSNPTEITKQKSSETKKLMFQDPEFKAMMTAASTGKNHTQQGRQNIAKALEGNQYRKGIPHSEEIKEQIRQSVARAYAEGRHAPSAGLKKGTKLGPMPEEEKIKRSVAQKGRIRTPEHSAAIAEGWRLRRERLKELEEIFA